MNHSHVHISNHMPHDTHQHHQHHSNALQEESTIFGHNKCNTSDHHSMMEMYFHTGFIETILFEKWTTTSIPLFIASWIFIFIMSILYEGIREFRQCLDDERLIKKSTIPNEENETELQHMNTELPESTIHVKKKIPLRPTEHVLHSILYVIHLSLSYLLMLTAMTFNIYLFLAIIFGIGTGHLLYTWSSIAPSTIKNERRV